MRRLIPIAALLTLFLIQNVHSAAVMSVDLGSEWMKIGIVSPGVPMEIVLNKESKRKTPSVVAIRDGVRTFGEDAVAVGVRFPKFSYKYVLDLLGKPYNHPIVQLYEERFPYFEIKESAHRRTPVFVHDEELSFTPEEIIAQLLTKAKEFAEINSGQPISEVVITIPGFFNQVERQAVIDAARLANLNVAQLMNDHAAIALNYGIFRRKELNDTPSHAMFFDMGAYSTKVALVEYKTVKTKEKGFVETVPQLQVLGFAFDRTLGGLEITLRLRDHLAKVWVASGGPDVRSNPRAMEKLLRESERLKTVLSANTEHYAQIEGLIDEMDFKALVTRAELEGLCEDIWPRVKSVIERARVAAGGAGLQAKMVVAGAGARVPKIAAILREANGGEEPSRGINADEAATLGAVYRAAAMAKGYRVAPMTVKDAVVYPVQVTFKRQTDGQEKLVKRTLFGYMNPYPQKKVITFNKHTDDFSFNVNYAELDKLPTTEITYLGNLNITTVNLNGVASALNKYQGENIESKGIKAHFAMDDSGILNLVNVEYVAEKTITAEEEEEESSLSKIGSTISRLFGSDTKDDIAKEYETKTDNEGQGENIDTVDKTENVTIPQNETEPPKVEQANLTEAAENKTSKPKVLILKEPVTAEVESIVSPFSEDHFKESLEKIKKLNQADKKRAQRETALNNLESFVIDALSKLDTEEFSDCGTPEEIEDIRTLCSQVSEWLYEDGYNADTEEYENKLMQLRVKSDPLFMRHWEHRERPDAVNALRSIINNSSNFLKMAQNFTKESNADNDIYTEVEIKTLTTKIQETETWLNKLEQEQKALKKHESIKLTVDLLREKMENLDREVKYLLNKMRLWKAKKPPVPKTSPKSEKKTAKNESESVSETKTEEEQVVLEEITPLENTTESSKNDTEEVTARTDIPELTEGEADQNEEKDEHSEL